MDSRPVAAIVSFRLGGSDGVSVEAAKWEDALGRLGFRSRRVAGAVLDDRRPDDTLLPELGIAAEGEPDASALEAALDGADLVVVENLLSLPLNLPAARTLAKVLAEHPRVVLRHHDLPWQREQYAAVDELPPDLDGAVHVVINDRSRGELAERGIDAHLIRNHFDLAPPAGHREATRTLLGVGERDIVVLHPVRAIPRKNVPGALELCDQLARRLAARPVRYWLPGPPEDGYDADLEHLLAASPVPVLRQSGIPMPDAYAAADLVAFPSSWEGFGNPVIESVAHRRPLAVSRYPVLEELLELGFDFLDPADPAGAAAAVSGVRDLTPTFDRNLDVARRHLDLALLPDRIGELLSEAGWSALARSA